MLHLVDKDHKAIEKALKLKVTVLDTKQHREVTADASGLACIHELCEDVDVKIEVVADQICDDATKKYTGSLTFYRIEPKITHVNFPVKCE